MKTALITGTSSGIGLQTAIMLLSKGWQVIGISRTSASIENENFIEYLQDLTDINQTEILIKKLLCEHSFSLLVNNAGIGYYGLCEELSLRKINEMVTANLTIPIAITSLMMRQLKKINGIIINISSVTAGKSNPHGAAYGATKAGLSSFSTTIFDEARKYGIRVITIEPDMTLTNLYRNADFEASDEENCAIEPSDVAKAIEFALDNLTITKMVLQPQYHRIKRKDIYK